MGNKKERQLTVLAALLFVTALLVYQTTGSIEVIKPYGLQSVLGPVPGYTMVRSTPLDDRITSFLDLDDYTQTRYEREGETVSLYIGYYFSLAKVSAAHSPLVCFPGQGWEIDLPTECRFLLGENSINYAEMTAKLGDKQELVMYWYQAHEKTAPLVYKNKIHAVLNKITGKKQEHAFVRVTIPFKDSDKDKARKEGRNFIKAFYPVFLSYINNASELSSVRLAEKVNR